MTPAAIHPNHSVEPIADDAWVERCGGGAAGVIIHCRSVWPIVYAARQLGFEARPMRRETATTVTFTAYFTKAKADRAIELVRAAASIGIPRWRRIPGATGLPARGLEAKEHVAMTRQRSSEARTASDYRKETRPRGEPTQRSKQIAALYGEGLTRSEIAERLGISKHAVSRAVGEVRAAGARP